MRGVAGTLRLDLSQFRELQAFAQFGTDDLDPSTRNQLLRGQRLTELLKQPQYRPLTLAQQVSILFAGTRGFLDDVPVEKVADFETAFHEYMRANAAGVMETLSVGARMEPETEEALTKAITDFKATVAY
jgi:F-type H+-transporting ATPase subunit alpha